MMNKKGSKKKSKKGIVFLIVAAILIMFIGCDWDEEYSDEYADNDYGYDSSYDDGSEEHQNMADSTHQVNPVDNIQKEISETDLSKYFSDSAIRSPRVVPKGNGEDKVTILIYMNGSNLESEDGEATTDLSEIVDAGFCDNVNILVQTMGTKKWDSKFGVAADRSQIYKVDGNGLTLLRDDLGQKDCTEAKTLSDFIVWGTQNYPADRYILHFWDHGGGPVYGFGYDEWNKADNASLTIDEMQTALKTAGVYFDFVGMDCCLMSCLEVCCAFYDFCDYMVLSEDFESGLGWSYTKWVKALYNNTSIPTTELGKMICDEMVRANETEAGGDKSSMSLIDEGKLKVLYAAWTDFAYANEDKLLGTNYSRGFKRAAGGRVHPSLLNRKLNKSRGWFDDWNYDFWEDDEENLSMAEYYVTDIMEVASVVDSDQSAALEAALNLVLVYVRNTVEDAGLTGLAVSLPYGDNDYYNSLKPIFSNAGLDNTYIGWLKKFVNVSPEYYSDSYHDEWDEEWNGWEDFEDYFDWGEWDFSDYDDDYWNDYDFCDSEWEEEYWYWYDDDDYYYDDEYYW